MPVIAFPVRAAAPPFAEFALLEWAGLENRGTAIGVFRFEPASGRLEFRLREDWDELDLDEFDREFCEALAADFEARIAELGGSEFLRSLEDSLSHTLRVSGREPAGRASLDDLFEEHVDARVRPFVTHLPLYALEAAATRFGEDRDMEVEPLGWKRVEGVRMTPDLFIARVVGRSMEPLIPDGSLCVFRANVTGSRQGKRLLIEQLGVTGSSARYTVKRYTSLKRQAQDETWEHSRIRLEPLNPEFPAFDLEEGRFRVLGEFVKVLPD